MFKKTTTSPRYVTEGQARELADELVRTALREQARDLEKHLMDIDRRLRELEKRR
jgi:demethoxyubiquinone hydroxylase (CLK1/Coq7/Cat5 family)